MSRRLADESGARAAGGDAIPAPGDPASAASHALKGPLQTIVGMAELLRDEAYGPLTHEQRRAIRRVVEGSEALDRRLEAVVGLVQADVYRPEADEGAVELPWIARAAVRRVAAEAGDRGWRVSDDVPPDHPPVRGGATELHTLLVTLLRVLLDEAHAPGGATLTVRARGPANGAARLELGAGPAGDGSNGPAVDASAAPAEEPNADGGGARDRTRPASFELYVARRMARVLGGRLWVERAGDGRPLGFRLAIPLHDGNSDG